MRVSKSGIWLAILLIAISFWSIAPVYFIVDMSFMHWTEIITLPTSLFPSNPTIANFLRVIGYSATGPQGEYLRPSGQWRMLIQGFYNIIFIAFTVMVITMIVAVPASYALGRYSIKGKGIMIAFLIATRTMPPVSVVIPYYLLYMTVGMVGTYIGLIIIDLTITIPIVVWILMGFFATLPRDIEKQARIDGCGRLSAFVKAVLPVAMPGIASTAIMAFLYSWNEFLFGMILSGGKKVMPINPVIYTWFNQGESGNAGLFTAGTCYNLLPAILISVILQKYITQLKIVDPTSMVVE